MADAAPRRGYFGRFGGRFVPETLMGPLEELGRVYLEARADPGFERELGGLLETYAGRPTPLYRARRIEAAWNTGPLYLKREDLLHTGAHKINNTLGQALLTRRMGKRRVVAETGAGQHGVATATACALLDLKCVVYMGEVDMERQAPNVRRMNLLGAEVRPVASGTRTLKDATNEAIRDWVATVETTHYVIGSTVGPDPFPTLVRDFQSVIGTEARRQMIEETGRLPDLLVACVGGGSNARGLFPPFRVDRMVWGGVEAGGRGPGRNAAALCEGSPGVLHGSYSYVLQDEEGQIRGTHSISAGLDYPGVGPEHSHWKDSGRAAYETVEDGEALRAFLETLRLEGILPAMEPSHALAYVRRAGKELKEKTVLLCLSGRGDKDVEIVARALREDGA